MSGTFAARPSHIEPLVSIVTPVYNGARYLPDLLDSTRDQTYGRIEHIVVDDGSTDGGATKSVIARYPHVRTWTHPNIGQYATLNEAISRSTGQIVAVINADDFYPNPHCVERAVRAFEDRADVGFVHGRTLIVDENRTPTVVQRPDWRWPESLLRSGFGLIHCSVFVRRALLDSFDITFDPTLGSVADIDWLIQLARSAENRVQLSDHLAAYRQHPASWGASLSIGDLSAQARAVQTRHSLNPAILMTTRAVLRLRVYALWLAALGRRDPRALSRFPFRNHGRRKPSE